MEAIRQYFISIFCAALSAAILSSLSEKTSFRKLLRMLCSLFVTITVLRPLVDLRLPELDDITAIIHSNADYAAAQGNAYRIRSVSGIIKDELEAYILKEAEAQGAAVTADIILDSSDPPLPIAVTIQGSFDASAEAALSELLARELGIPKEHQTWIRQELLTSADS